MPRKFLIGQQNWRDCTENDFFDIPFHENYEINIFGDVYRKELNTIWKRNRKHPTIPRRKMSIVKNNNGYSTVSLDGKRYCLHKILAETFLENKYGFSVVDHLDGDKQNNYLGNLEWTTQKINTQRAYQLGLTSRNKKVMCMETKTVFTSTLEAGRWLGGSNKGMHVARVARGERKTAYGYHWQYV